MDPIQRYKYLVFSLTPDVLVKFYTDTLGLSISRQLNIPNDYGYDVAVGDGSTIWIGKHDKVAAKNPDPYRHIINLYVNSVSGWYEKVKSHPEVTIVCEPELMPGYTEENPRYVSTFLDPEGNCLQFMGGK